MDTEKLLSTEYLFYLLVAAVSVVIVVLALKAFTGTFVFGLFTYYATRPLYRRVKKHVGSRNIAAGLTLVLFSLPFIVLLTYTGIVAADELRTLANETNPNLITEALRPYITQLGELRDPLTIIGDTSNLSVVVDQLLGYVALIASFLINVFLILTFTFYFLRDGHRFKKMLLSVTPDGDGVDRFLYGMDRDFQTLFFGNILHAGLTAIVGAVSYTALSVIAPSGLGIQYPVLIGFLTGIGSLIPIVGMKIVYVPVLALLSARAYFLGPEYYWFPLVFFGVSLVIVDTIPDFVVRPYVSGERLHTGALMFAYIVGPLVFGWYGLFFAPIMLVVVTNFYSFVLPELVNNYTGDRDDLEMCSQLSAEDTVRVDMEDGTVEATVQDVFVDEGNIRVEYGDDDEEEIVDAGEVEKPDE